jgi:diguanylate cyclase (GGDEF)-like protein/PAS domain S-box-containing protein
MGSDDEERAPATSARQHLEPVHHVLGHLSRLLSSATAATLDAAIAESLSAVGEALEVDAMMTLLVDEADRIVDGWSWAAPGIIVQRPAIGSDVREGFGSSIEFLALGQAVAVEDLAELELNTSERSLADTNRVRGLLLAPVRAGSSFLGLTALQTSDGPRRWTDAEITQVELVAQLFAQAVRRVRERGALAAADARARRIAEYIPDGLLLLDLDGRLRWASPSFLRSTGLAIDAITDRFAVDFVHPDDQATVVQAFTTDRSRGSGVEVRLPAGDGWRWVSASWQLVHDDDPAVPDEVVVSLRDIHEDRLHTQRLEEATAHDALTGAMNRHGFDRAVGALADDGAEVVLAYVDVDRFKAVNDDLGHEAGDEVLRRVALGLRSAVRVGDLVARLGGDEFCVVADATGLDHGAEGFAQRLSAAAREILTTAPPEASVSIGVAGPAPAAQIERLRSSADAAMYRVKRAGGDGWSVG